VKGVEVKESKANSIVKLLDTLAKTEIVYPKNVRAKVAMDLT